jgi:hypothetical protein
VVIYFLFLSFWKKGEVSFLEKGSETERGNTVEREKGKSKREREREKERKNKIKESGRCTSIF